MSNHASQHFPLEVLERRAEEERNRIGESASELKSSLQETIHERLDVNKYARRNFQKIAGVASMLALLSGYAVAGLFTRH